MGKLVLITLLAGLAAGAPEHPQQPDPQNLDFEAGDPGTVPPGWSVPTPGYVGTLNEDSPKQGKRCAHLRATDTGERHEFGNIMQSFDAQAYRGKIVRLRAAVRADRADSTDGAQMWLRVDRAGGRMGFFDNMQDRRIRERSWQYYEIVSDVHDDAERINLGFIIFGETEAWFDDVSFEIIGEAEKLTIEPPRPLEGRALDNLVAFTHLLGYVRYFHPTDEAGETDWDEFAVAGVRAVESAASAAELVSTLEDLFHPIAPTVRIFETGHVPPAPVHQMPPADTEGLRVVAWKHRGVGLGRIELTYVSKKISWEVRDGKLPDGAPDPAEPFAADLGGGVSCLVPLSVYVDLNGTIPKARGQEKRASGVGPNRYTGNDRGTRLADVALCWNVMQHFYPYFDVVDTDWSAALVTALRAAATDKDERAFLDTLRRLMAALHDGHGNVGGGGDVAHFTLPVFWDWVEGQLVVIYVDDQADAEAETGGLEPGDVVRKIDGREPGQALADIEELISSATPQFRRYKALRQLAAGSEGDKVVLDIENAAGEKRSVTLRRTTPRNKLREARPPTVHRIMAGLYYLNFNRITNEEFQEALPNLEQATGIVFDFRGYPRNIHPETFFPHIIDSPVTSPQWHIPVLRRPDRQTVEFERGGEWHLTPAEPFLKAKKAFIIDGRCISYAESCLGIIENYKLGELVGGPTAGTNGNVNPFMLPGGYQVYWTGMKVLKHDGSQHHGIGILPTIPVSRTIQGIRDGRDELLEKAIEIVSGG